jgi:hypothetical protein
MRLHKRERFDEEEDVNFCYLEVVMMVVLT